jgi:hypothetical protein
MTDQDKINWFNKTMTWVKDNGGVDAIKLMAESSSTAPCDLFYSFLEEIDKVTLTPVINCASPSATHFNEENNLLFKKCPSSDGWLVWNEHKELWLGVDFEGKPPEDFMQPIMQP